MNRRHCPLVCILTPVLAMLLLAPGVHAGDTAHPLPVTQPWSDTALIAVDDDWSGVPGIEGRRGDGLVSDTGADPQTILADGAATPLQVLANQVDPAALDTGGVAEFEVTDPTVALQASGTADAPHLLLFLDTTGQQTITVSYRLRDLDDSADDALQLVALHYRIGGSGPFTNVPEAFVADATTGPNQATATTHVSVTLPAEVEDQALVLVRILTANAAGSDEWVGVDDLQVTGQPAGDRPPVVAATVPLSGALNIPPSAPVTVHFREAVTATAPWLALDCAASGVHTTTVAGGPVTFVLTPTTSLAAGEYCTATVLAAQVVDQDDPPTPMAADYTWHFTTGAIGACFDGTATRIHDIQGSGTASALISSTVTIEAVVVGDFQGGGGLDGFYVQEEAADSDTDPATSEGIFVYDPTTLVEVAAGQVVRVTGVVAEYEHLTEVGDLAGVDLCGPAPAPTPITVTLPLSDTGEWERYEGMQVAFTQTLTVSDHYNLARYGEVVLSGNGRLFQPTHVAAPGEEAIAAEAANARNRILLDDANLQQNRSTVVYPPPAGLSVSNTLRVGDVVTGLVGIVDERFASYRIQPLALGVQPVNLRPGPPARQPGEIVVAAANLANYFVTIDDGNPICGPAGDLACRGADSEEELTRQRAKLVAALTGLDADVLALSELENSSDDRALADLVTALNAQAGGDVYAYVATGAVGTDAIRVGLLYRPAAISLQGTYTLLTTAVDPNFLDEKNRPVLAQTFATGDGERFTVAAVHLKSKGSDCDDVDDPDLGDGQGNCNITRTNAAKALAAWLEGDPTGSGDSDFLIVGDLNSYAREDPITALATAGYVDLIAQHGSGDLYSYLFDGASGYLDYALASASLAAQVTGAVEWHIDADEPRALDYNTEFKTSAQVASFFAADAYRAADHDPLMVRLCFGTCEAAASLYLPAVMR